MPRCSMQHVAKVTRPRQESLEGRVMMAIALGVSSMIEKHRRGLLHMSAPAGFVSHDVVTSQVSAALFPLVAERTVGGPVLLVPVCA